MVGIVGLVFGGFVTFVLLLFSYIAFFVSKERKFVILKTLKALFLLSFDFVRELFGFQLLPTNPSQLEKFLFEQLGERYEVKPLTDLSGAAASYFIALPSSSSSSSTNKKKKLFIKTLPLEFAKKVYTLSTQTTKGEIDFLNRYNLFQEERQQREEEEEEETFLTPKCVLAVSEDYSARSVIVFEHLQQNDEEGEEGEEGKEGEEEKVKEKVILWNVGFELDVEETLIFVRTLAKFQLSFWGVPFFDSIPQREKRGDDGDRSHHSDLYFFNETIEQKKRKREVFLQLLFQVGFEKTKKMNLIVPTSNGKIRPMERVVNFFEKCGGLAPVQKYLLYYSSDVCSDFTLVHGDFHLMNLYLLERKKGEEKERVPGFFDFQTTTVGSPFFDLCYFLLTAASSDTVHSHLPLFLDTYLSIINKGRKEKAKREGREPERDIQREDLEKYFAKCVVLICGMWFMCVGFGFTENPNLKHLLPIWLEKNEKNLVRFGTLEILDSFFETN